MLQPASNEVYVETRASAASPWERKGPMSPAQAKKLISNYKLTRGASNVRQVPVSTEQCGQ